METTLGDATAREDRVICIRVSQNLGTGRYPTTERQRKGMEILNVPSRCCYWRSRTYITVECAL
jgi:hypothetical protein